MRTYLHINLSDQSVEKETFDGEAMIKCGRYFIAKTLLEKGVATVDPLSPENPLIFSAGPFAGTNFSNANRLSVGCKSPLTGGIKEANSGGTFAFALGQLEMAGLTLYGASDEWVIIRITKDGEIAYEPADEIMGKGNHEAAALLFEKYGEKVSLALCGPVGEYQGLLAGIAFTDPEGNPDRLAARGGVGAVMGSKKVKAIVIDRHKMPQFVDRKKVMKAVKEYGSLLKADPVIKTLSDLGTANMADITNYMGGLPVRNFTSGQLVDTNVETLKMGGAFIREQNIARGGKTTHACMPGCMIQCSNEYADEDGNKIVTPLEYETICLLGTNLGITNPDHVAELNNIANDLGIDTIETGATLGILLDMGKAEFADMEFLKSQLDDIRIGNENGRLLAQGTWRVGQHYGFHRLPVIKKQAISAYDPRVSEVTGLTMMLTAQGADHTAGNVPTYRCEGHTTKELVEVSLESQLSVAVADSLGLCVFGRSVTTQHYPLILNALNDGMGTNYDQSFLEQLAQDTLDLEDAFNKAAGFTEADDELPKFFYDEALPPSNKKALHHSREANQGKIDIIASRTDTITARSA